MRWFPALLLMVGLGLTTPALAQQSPASTLIGHSCSDDYSTKAVGGQCLYLVLNDEADGTKTAMDVPKIYADSVVVVELAQATSCSAGTVLIESRAGDGAGLWHEVASTTTASTLTLDASGVTRIILTYPPGAEMRATIANEASCTPDEVDVIVLIYPASAQ